LVRWHSSFSPEVVFPSDTTKANQGFTTIRSQSLVLPLLVSFRHLTHPPHLSSPPTRLSLRISRKMSPKKVYPHYSRTVFSNDKSRFSTGCAPSKPLDALVTPSRRVFRFRRLLRMVALAFGSAFDLICVSGPVTLSRLLEARAASSKSYPKKRESMPPRIQVLPQVFSRY